MKKQTLTFNEKNKPCLSMKKQTLTFNEKTNPAFQ